MSFEAIRYEVEGGRATLTLNRPDSLNAINAQMRREVIDAMGAASSDDQVKAVVLTGAGDRAFSAGADIGEFRDPEDPAEERNRRHERSWHQAISDCPKPVIAQIRGYCLGGGLEAALACDLRVAGHSAQFGFPEVSIGLIPGAGGTQRLSRVVGVHRALELILVAERIGSERAYEIGLLTRLAPDEELTEAVEELVEKLITMAPLALRYAKEAVRRGFDMGLEDGLRLEADLATVLSTTADRMEGATAFSEGRTPRFEGR